MKYFLLSLSLVLTVISLSRCGSSSSSSTATNPYSAALGVIAVSSPTTQSTSTASLWGRGLETAQAFIQFGPLNSLLKMFGMIQAQKSFAAAAPTEDVVIKPMSEMLADVSTAQSAAPETAAANVNVSNLSPTTLTGPVCYGPGWTDNATGSSVNRPTGDLGIVLANASGTDTEACAAAQVNYLIKQYIAPAQEVIDLVSTMIAAEKTLGSALPAISESKDVKADMPTISGMTISTLTWARLANDANGFAVYKVSLTGTLTSGSKPITITVYNSPTNATNTNFKGLIQAVLPHTASMGGSGTHKGYSVLYEKADSVITMAVDRAANRSVDSTDFFSTTTGRVDYSKTSFGEDAHKMFYQTNTSTGESIIHYAWQAGSGDGATRVFEIKVPANTGSVTATAFFGFGAAVGSLSETFTSGTAMWATGFRCDWLNARTTVTTAIQKQVITRTSLSQKFSSSSVNINFAPSPNCNSASWTISGNANFNGTRSTTNHDLVTPPGSTDSTFVSAVTVPSFTLP